MREQVDLEVVEVLDVLEHQQHRTIGAQPLDQSCTGRVHRLAGRERRRDVPGVARARRGLYRRELEPEQRGDHRGFGLVEAQLTEATQAVGGALRSGAIADAEDVGDEIARGCEGTITERDGAAMEVRQAAALREVAQLPKEAAFSDSGVADDAQAAADAVAELADGVPYDLQLVAAP